jgi:hypothetical protein
MKLKTATNISTRSPLQKIKSKNTKTQTFDKAGESRRSGGLTFFEG